MITYHDSLNDVPEGALIIGIEATRTEHRDAIRASGGVNIDPQHGGGDADALFEWIRARSQGSIELGHQAFSGFGPLRSGLDSAVMLTAHAGLSSLLYHEDQRGRHVALLTSRPDLDALSAMALFAMADSGDSPLHPWSVQCLQAGSRRIEDHPASADVAFHVLIVHEADNFSVASTPWAPSPLPTEANPWAGAAGSVDTRRPLAAINAACFDRSVPLSERVSTVRHWLLTGEEPAEYRTRVEARRLDLIRQAEVGEPVPGVAAVVVDLPGATGLGYCLAPTVVCEAPNFLGRPRWRKYTVTHWGPVAPERWACMVAQLNDLESHAGGRPVRGPGGVVMVCPTCNKWRRGRYCNDGHPMRRTRPETDDEWRERVDAIERSQPVGPEGAGRRRGLSRTAMSTVALSLVLGGGSFGGER